MATPSHAYAQDVSLITTKLYVPPVRPELVPRPRLVERLNEGLNRKLTLISAPAGFGKTTLVTEWMQRLKAPRLQGQAGDAERSFTWLSLDENATFSQILPEMGILLAMGVLFFTIAVRRFKFA